MKRIGLYVKQDKEALKKADEFERWLCAQNIEVVREQTHIPENLEQRNRPVQAVGRMIYFACLCWGGMGRF